MLDYTERALMRIYYYIKIAIQMASNNNPNLEMQSSTLTSTRSCITTNTCWQNAGLKDSKRALPPTSFPGVHHPLTTFPSIHTMSTTPQNMVSTQHPSFNRCYSHQAPRCNILLSLIF